MLQDIFYDRRAHRNGSALQCLAVLCSVLQYVTGWCTHSTRAYRNSGVYQCVVVRCSVLLCVVLILSVPTGMVRQLCITPDDAYLFAASDGLGGWGGAGAGGLVTTWDVRGYHRWTGG